MWIFLNDAYFSIVHKDCADNELLVRARRKGDIERVFGATNVVSVDKADYQYRAVMTRDNVAAILSNVVYAITYPNFKNSVKDAKLRRIYNRVWEVAGGWARYAGAVR
jgi:hypothetical protein